MLTETPSIVVLKSDLTYGQLIGEHIRKHWPRARVSVFHRGKVALKCIRRTKPDLFLTGVKLDDMDGLEHLEALVDSDVAILVVTARADPHTFRMLRHVRYVSLFDAREGLEMLPTVIRQSLRRQPYVSPSFLRQLGRPYDGAIDSLTDTEQLVLAVIGDGTNNTKAGRSLGISPATVKTHRKFIMGKLNIHDKALLTRYVVQQGLVLLTPRGVRRPGFERRLAVRAHGNLQATDGTERAAQRVTA